MKKLKPDARRAIITHAARQRMGFFEALHFLIYEGIKARANWAGTRTQQHFEAADYEIKNTEKQRRPIRVDGLWVK